MVDMTSPAARPPVAKRRPPRRPSVPSVVAPGANAPVLQPIERVIAVVPEPEHEAPAIRRFLDRELSWLAFNERVLELAQDPDLPLLERTRFLAIFASNLDEFFMIRVAGLKRRIAAGLAVRAASGLEPREVLSRIRSRAHELQALHARVFGTQIAPALAEHNITIARWEQLDPGEQQRLHGFFRDQVFPVLTPLAVDPAPPVP
jgi:polyphosphate kinase